MSDPGPTFSVRIDKAHNELHFVTSGRFDEAAMNAFLADIARAVGPILASGQNIRALGDLSDYTIQPQNISKKMAEVLRSAEGAGIERTAIIMTSPIVKKQYQRISEGRNVKIFDNRIDALLWLRSAD